MDTSNSNTNSNNTSQEQLSTRAQKLLEFAKKYKSSDPAKSLSFLQKLLKFEPNLSEHPLIKNFWIEMEVKKKEETNTEIQELEKARQENKETKGSLKSQFEQMPSIRVDLETPNYKTSKSRNWKSEWASKKTIQEFGYGFSEDGFLLQLDTGKPFEWKSQEHYDFLGDAVIAHLQTVLKKNYGLKEIILNQENESDSSKHVNVFMTPYALETTDTLLVLIQGMGAVRPPMWALSLCINSKIENGKFVGGLRAGTMFEYQEKAAELGWEYIILNPNQNYSRNSKCEAIENHKNPIEHTLTSYDNLISKSKAKQIVIVAHSYGGTAVVEGLLRQRSSILNKLKCIVFTDSNHQQIHIEGLSDEAKGFLQQYAQNYVRSEKPLGTPLGGKAGVNILSAGTTDHIWTSHKAYTHAFEYMTLCLQMNGTPEDRFNAASSLKKEGNDAFLKADYQTAQLKYARSILITTQTQFDISLEFERNALLLACHSNLSACTLQMGDNSTTVKHATNAVDLKDKVDEKQKGLIVKSYFRRAQAYFNQSDFELANEDIKEGLLLDPTNAALISLGKKIDIASQKKRIAQKKAFAEMFSK